MSVSAPRQVARLRSMEPFGLGTPAVESQTSYLHRLALRLSISHSSLLDLLAPPGEELFPESWTGAVSHAINGAREAASRVSHGLIDATMRPALGQISLLPWAAVLPDWGLVRPALAWCPPCLADNPYERLAWSIALVTVCAEHEVALETKCHACGRSQPFLTGTSYVARCRWCKADLALTPAQPVADPWHQFAATQVGSLLEAAPDPVPTRELVAAGLRRALKGASMNGALLAEATRLSKGTVSQWLSGKNLPSLESGLRASAATGVGLRELLLGAGGAPGIEAVNVPGSSWAGKQVRDADRLRAGLDAALAASTPVSLDQVAKDLGAEPKALRTTAPDLTAAIVKRRANSIAADAEERLSIAVAYLEAAIELVTTRGVDATRRAIEPHLPAGLTLQEPELREAWHAMTGSP